MRRTNPFAERFEVYRRAYRLSLEVLTYLKESNKATQPMEGQLRKSITSICANFAEGFGKSAFSKREFRRHLMIAVGSANESIVWIDFAEDAADLDDARAEKWRIELGELAKMLVSLAKSLNPK